MTDIEQQIDKLKMRESILNQQIMLDRAKLEEIFNFRSDLERIRDKQAKEGKKPIVPDDEPAMMDVVYR